MLRLTNSDCSSLKLFLLSHHKIIFFKKLELQAMREAQAMSDSVMFTGWSTWRQVWSVNLECRYSMLEFYFYCSWKKNAWRLFGISLSLTHSLIHLKSSLAFNFHCSLLAFTHLTAQCVFIIKNTFLLTP